MPHSCTKNELFFLWFWATGKQNTENPCKKEQRDLLLMQLKSHIIADKTRTQVIIFRKWHNQNEVKRPSQGLGGLNSELDPFLSYPHFGISSMYPLPNFDLESWCSAKGERRQRQTLADILGNPRRQLTLFVATERRQQQKASNPTDFSHSVATHDVKFRDFFPLSCVLCTL